MTPLPHTHKVSPSLAVERTLFGMSELTPLVFVDLETTGLGYEDGDPAQVRDDAILEVAALLVDPQSLVEISTFGPVAVAAQDSDLSLMNDFVRDMHTRTGLLDRVVGSSAVPVGQVDADLADWMVSHGAGGSTHLAGSSVSLDALFIRRHMPLTHSLLHYRILDVSSFVVALQGWAPDVLASISAHVGESTHEAMADIRRSLEILRKFREIVCVGLS